MSNLEPTVFLAKGAKVMLTMNLWSTVGLCNGATGTILVFIYESNHQPPDLPIAVIAHFDDYSRPSISDTVPSCVPICPVTVSIQTLDGHHEAAAPFKACLCSNYSQESGSNYVQSMDRYW